MHTKSVTELSESLKSGDISSVELTKQFLTRAKKLNSQLNCLITITEEEALKAAQAADIAIKNKTAGKLTGIPIIHKDIFCTENIRTSCASKMLDNFISPYDATVVTKLKQAGTIMIAKANMDEFAMGSSNENSYYGCVKNPWDLNYVPGGSSGGSAAAVGARLAPIATSTDTGGSIRQPASFCGITGIKPTYGRISRFGMIAFASSLDQAGPMGCSARDCAIMLEAMSGFDEKDSTSVDFEVPKYSVDINDSIKGLKIGIPKEFVNADLPNDIAKIFDEAKKVLTNLGAEFIEISLPSVQLAIPAYYIIAPAECSSNLSRYDGVRFGHRTKNYKNLDEFYKNTRSEGFGDEVKRRILIGTYVLSSGYYDAYYLKAQKIRTLISNDFKAAFSEVDVILGPTTPGTAFKIGDKTSDPISMYLSDIYTSCVNLAGLPGMSFPAGFINNLPVGLQLIGNYFQESKILNVAHLFQQETTWHKKMPKIAEDV